MSVSVVIPSRNEPYLERTIRSVQENFTGDYEIIVVLDGETQYKVPYCKNVIYINNINPKGIRHCINDAVSLSGGDYIIKLDAHCSVSPGFDEILTKNCDLDEVVIARRYTLDLVTWDKFPRIVDYFYLSCPWTHPKSLMMQSCPWVSRTESKMDIPIDETMCFQGSMWMMQKYNWNYLGKLSTRNIQYAEHHEISMRTWLYGGKVRVNKNAWYAHPKVITNAYKMDMDTVYRDHAYSAEYWIKKDNRKHELDWLIEKFWPLPTENTRHKVEKYYWPEDWRKYYDGTL